MAVMPSPATWWRSPPISVTRAWPRRIGIWKPSRISCETSRTAPKAWRWERNHDTDCSTRHRLLRAAPPSRAARQRAYARLLCVRLQAALDLREPTPRRDAVPAHPGADRRAARDRLPERSRTAPRQSAELPQRPPGRDQVLHALSGISRAIGTGTDPSHPRDPDEEGRVPAGPTSHRRGNAGHPRCAGPYDVERHPRSCHAASGVRRRLAGVRTNWRRPRRPHVSAPAHRADPREGASGTVSAALENHRHGRADVGGHQRNRTRTGALRERAPRRLHPRRRRIHPPQTRPSRGAPVLLAGDEARVAARPAAYLCAHGVASDQRPAQGLAVARTRTCPDHGDLHAGRSVREAGNPGGGHAANPALRPFQGHRQAHRVPDSRLRNAERDVDTITTSGVLAVGTPHNNTLYI